MSRHARSVDALLGVVYAGLALGLVVLGVSIYNKAFTDSTDVVLRTGALGNSLQKGSDVQLNGVPVGRISAIEPTGDGAKLTLALQPDTAESLPRETVARLLPKTLFGERYVQLVAPPSGGRLEDGDQIRQDTSAQAVELEDLFDELLPTLRAIQPAKLAATLGELSVALDGQGEAIGDSMSAWGDYVGQLNPHVPQLTEDLAKLGKVADSWNAAAPDLLNALQTLTTTSRTVADQQTQLQDLFASVITASDTTTGFMTDNEGNITSLSTESRKALAAIRPYATQFPCTLSAMRDFIPVMDKTLGKGTDQPGIHARLNVVESRGKYVAGKDAVRYSSGGKARCPYATGAARVAPVAGQPASIPAPPSRALAQQLGAQAGSIIGLGPANSPAENKLVAAAVAADTGVSPRRFPQWGSLLLGATLTAAEGSVR